MASNSNEDEFLDSSGELHSDDKVDIETKHEVSDNSELIGRYRREANEIGLKGKELTSYITNSLATHYEDLRKKELIAMELEKQQKLKSMELDKQQELKSMELKLKADEMRLKEEENEIRKAEMLQKERLHKESLTAKKNDKAAASKLVSGSCLFPTSVAYGFRVARQLLVVLPGLSTFISSTFTFLFFLCRKKLC